MWRRIQPMTYRPRPTDDDTTTTPPNDMIGRPTLSAIGLCLLTFTLQTIGGIVGIGVEAFALSLPLEHRPWTIVASVYAHGGITHLLANTIALLIVGPLVAYITTPWRFHAFFIGTGSISGLTQVVASTPFGGASVLGASGAVFGLFGYLLVGNRASMRVISWLPIERRGRLLIIGALAVVLTAVTAAPGVALVAHATGFCLGAAAGRAQYLHCSRDR